jgi:hypothetical protein
MGALSMDKSYPYLTPSLSTLPGSQITKRDCHCCDIYVPPLLMFVAILHPYRAQYKHSLLKQMGRFAEQALSVRNCESQVKEVEIRKNMWEKGKE